MKCLLVFFIFCLVGAASHSAGASLRVLTYNIHHGEGTDGALDLERVLRVIQSAEADVVCLQEVDRNCERTDRIDFPSEIAKRLNMNVAFGANLKLGDGDYGVATLTRFDIVSYENLRLPGAQGAEPRGCLKAIIDVGGQKIHVLNTHLGLDEGERVTQAAAIVDSLEDSRTVLAGDFNETAGEAAMAILQRALQDTFVGNRGEASTTYGRGDEAKRIDFVLVSRDMNVLSSRVIVTVDAEVASDHLPYVTDLALPAPPETAADRGIYDQADDERITEAVTGSRKP